MADPITLNAGVVLAILVAGVGLMLTLVSAVSYARLRSPKLLFAGGAFLLLAAKGALVAWRGVADREIDLAPVALDAAVLGFLYASVAAR